MNWMNIAIGFFLTVHILVCIFMVTIILMQRSKQEGLGAAFGSGITDSMFGAGTSQVLVKATVFLAALFFILTIILARLYSTRNNTENSLSRKLLATPAATAPAIPGADATATDSASKTTVPATASTEKSDTAAPAVPAKK
jgi:preprotein translocase subunit SecG